MRSRHQSIRPHMPLEIHSPCWQFPVPILGIPKFLRMQPNKINISIQRYTELGNSEPVELMVHYVKPWHTAAVRQQLFNSFINTAYNFRPFHLFIGKHDEFKSNIENFTQLLNYIFDIFIRYCVYLLTNVDSFIQSALGFNPGLKVTM